MPSSGMNANAGREKLRDITTILFDMDNTLIDTKGADKTACDQVCKYLQELGVKKTYAKESAEKFYQYVRAQSQDPVPERSDVDTWRTLLWEEALGPQLKCHADRAYRLWKTIRMDYIRFTPGVEEMLLSLRKSYKLGLITNGPSRQQWEKVYKVNGQNYFDVILVGGDCQKEKPNPFIFERAFEHLDVSPEECIIVGDKLETDIRGGVNSGVAATVWLCAEDNPWDPPDPVPDFKIRQVCDLLDLLPKTRKSSLRRTRRLSCHSAHPSTIPSEYSSAVKFVDDWPL